MAGKLIVIDGIDGSGKRTQAEQLMVRWEREGKKVSFFDFPVYGSFFGKMIGRYLRGEFGSLEKVSPYFAAMLYAQDRLLQRDAMLASLQRGDIVLCNRYVQSNLAYQSVRLPLQERDGFIAWNEDMEYAVNRMPKPDAIIFLDVSPEIGQQLVDKKGGRSYVNGRDLHETSLSFLKHVHGMYRKLAKERGWIVVACEREGRLLSREEIHNRIDKALKDSPTS
ncbi:MAG: dTMP kinase [Nanoarchaeota archaeon]